MGWPKLNDQCRIYFEKRDKSYMLVLTECGKHGDKYDVVANVQSSSNPNLCSCSCTIGYLRSYCKRVQWSDLPVEWKKAFRNIMRNNQWDVTNPKRIKGFWKMREWKLLEFARKNALRKKRAKDFLRKFAYLKPCC